MPQLEQTKFMGGFGAILTQVDEKGNHHVMSYGSDN